jgi:hypothetical protein
VTVRHHDLVPDYLAFERAAAGGDAAVRRALWRELYESRHPDVFADYRSMGEPDDFDQALISLAGDSDAFEARARLVADLTAEHAPRVADLLGSSLDELPLVTMVGLYRSDCWVDDLDGAPTVFFAIEQFRSPAWAQASTVHETTHFVHAGVQPERWDDEVIGLRMLMEGIAITASHALLPDLPEWTHFNFEPDEIDPWLAACEHALPAVEGRLRRLLRSTDAEETARYFYPDWWRESRDVPEKLGYYAGARVVGRLGRRKPLAELARLSPSDALALLDAAL